MDDELKAMIRAVQQTMNHLAGQAAAHRAFLISLARELPDDAINRVMKDFYQRGEAARASGLGEYVTDDYLSSLDATWEALVDGVRR